MSLFLKSCGWYKELAKVCTAVGKRKYMLGNSLLRWSGDEVEEVQKQEGVGGKSAI